MASRFPHLHEEKNNDESSDRHVGRLEKHRYDDKFEEKNVKDSSRYNRVHNYHEQPLGNDIYMIKYYPPASRSPFHVPINEENVYVDRWDDFHVRMSCSPQYIGTNRQQRWSVISGSLKRLEDKCVNEAASIDDFKRTIENCGLQRYNIDCLEHVINEIYSDDQRSRFMNVILPGICNLARHVDRVCSTAPPLLRAGTNCSVTMSQLQAASLLACSFFCLFPYRAGSNIKKQSGKFQNPNFNTLYQAGPREKLAKLQCILNYFHRVITNTPTDLITFKRYVLSDDYVPKWSKSVKPLIPMHVTLTQKIEDIDKTLQVDFANKYIGGGVLTTGCVQEEIRFAICPEMLVSLLICEVMAPNECVYLIGCERYSKYNGYSTTFQFVGDHFDPLLKDARGRKQSRVVAIDATFFRNKSNQYTKQSIKRELVKAYTGFHTENVSTQAGYRVATGHWGCGAFNGDKELKGIIQLMAASEAGSPLIYAAYRDERFSGTFLQVYEHLRKENATVGDLSRYLRHYYARSSRSSLFQFILTTPVSSLD